MSSSSLQGLSVSERVAVQASLTKLSVLEGLVPAQLAFWGRLRAVDRDYLVARAVELKPAEGLPKDAAPATVTKAFYVSADGGVSFAQLPAPDAWAVQEAAYVSGLFSGNLGKKHKKRKPRKEGDGENEDEEEDDEEEEEEEEEEDEDEEDGEDGGEKAPKPVDPSKRRLTEQERLSAVVRAIDEDTCLTPLGAYVRVPTGDVRRNASFGGLTPEKLADLSSYGLLRAATSDRTNARVRKAGATNVENFLDSLADQAPPKSAWSVQTDPSGLKATVRSLVWLGYEYQIEAGAGEGAGRYDGTGERNADLMFMI